MVCKEAGREQFVKAFQNESYISIMKKFLVFIALTLLISSAFSQNFPQYEKASFIKGSDTLNYRILYPLNYKPGKKYPLVVFLHGSGERGKDNNLQLAWGADLFLKEENRKNFPAIIIFPQCPVNSFWAQMSRKSIADSLGTFSFESSKPPTTSLLLVMEMLDEWAASGKVNKKKIYVGGLSMGGMGTFEILWRKPGFFAAAIPICGAGDPAKVPVYAKKMPVWMFHGDKDPAVPVGNSRLMNNALKASGARVLYTEYPGVGHDSWKNAFAEKELLPWLFRQKRK